MTTDSETTLATTALRLAGDARRLAAGVERRHDRGLAAEVRRVAIRLEELSDYLLDLDRNRLMTRRPELPARDRDGPRARR